MLLLLQGLAQALLPAARFGSGATAATECHSQCCCKQAPVSATVPLIHAVDLEACDLEAGMWEAGASIFLLPPCPILEADLDTAVKATWAHHINAAQSRVSRLLKFPANALWPYRQRTRGYAGICPKDLDCKPVFVCDHGGTEALAAEDEDKSTLSTTCCLCNKSCPRGEGGLDSYVLLHSHYYLRKATINSAVAFAVAPQRSAPSPSPPFPAPVTPSTALSSAPRRESGGVTLC